MNVHLKRKTFKGIGVLIALVVLLFAFRFIFNGGEDSWICVGNKWIKHGYPNYPKPDDPCGKRKPLPKTKDECLQIGGVWKKQGPEPLLFTVVVSGDILF